MYLPKKSCFPQRAALRPADPSQTPAMENRMRKCSEPNWSKDSFVIAVVEDQDDHEIRLQDEVISIAVASIDTSNLGSDHVNSSDASSNWHCPLSLVFSDLRVVLFVLLSKTCGTSPRV